jgi:hypothetical protein
MVALTSTRLWLEHLMKERRRALSLSALTSVCLSERERERERENGEGGRGGEHLVGVGGKGRPAKAGRFGM